MPCLKSSLIVLVTLAAGCVAQSIVELLSGRPELSNFTSFASRDSGFITTLSSASNITVLAPNNEAIANAMKSMPSNILNRADHVRSLLDYHVLNGTYRSADLGDKPKFWPTILNHEHFANLTAGEQQVVKAVLMDDHGALYSGFDRPSMVSRADMSFNRGLVHIIDSVLVLPANVSTTAITLNLTAVAGALATANLTHTVDTLSGVTIFAPSNAAFQAIGNLVGGLSHEKLVSILNYHVVPVRAFSVDLTNDQKLKTAQGGEITIRTNNGDVYANGAKVITANVITNNGVIHVIDGVLNPNATNDEPDTSASTQAPAFPSATRSSGVPFTSGVPTPTGSGMTTASATAGAGGNPNAAGSITSNIVITVLGAALALAASMII
ncbi:Fasciclin-domain-containing protein [Tuber magnatum]|uniref:Fasciclin-domain-containing protein n=1 Tax=Tuber magnatum TaxID=42249 RepID=A0A317SR50_9PEZI|nr:Fasciclin-domain-containing protein [Tuber magnatum]